MPAQTVIKLRRDTAANWTSADPTLAAGEIAFETDTNKIKVGDGSTAWSSLDYASGAGTAAEVTYDNSSAELVATNVKGALDELSLTKANVSDLSTNLNVYATTATSDISGYNVIVSNIDDADYDDVAVNVPTGAITADDQLIASLAAPADLFSGVVGPINVVTIGSIRKTAGNSSAFASFYFEVYKRAANGTETLVGTSDNTGDVNPETSDYQEFNATAFTQFGTMLDTDRVVLKFYANLTGNSGAEYDFQFGGSNPVRTLIPVPASVIVAHIAQEVMTDTTNFDGLLSASDTTVQAALETLDDFVIPPGTVASDTAPSSPEVGQMWWDSSDGSLYIYYDGYWVAAVTGITGPRGADNIVTSATAPEDTSVLWIDTDEPGDAVLPLGGTTGQVLSKVDGADYNTAWADAAGGGGMTLISSTTLSGVSTTISSIPQTYKNLYLVVSNAYCDNTTDPTVYYDCRVVPNGSIENFWGFMSGVTITATTAFPIISNISSNTSSKNAVAFQIIDYTSTDYKQAYCFGSYFTDRADSGGSTSGVNNRTGVFTHTSGITSLEITTSDPVGFTGGSILLYGVS